MIRSILTGFFKIFLKLSFLLLFLYLSTEALSHIYKIDKHEYDRLISKFKILEVDNEQLVLTDYLKYIDDNNLRLFQQIGTDTIRSEYSRINYTTKGNSKKLNVKIEYWHGDNSEWFYYNIVEGEVFPEKYRNKNPGHMFTSFAIYLAIILFFKIIKLFIRMAVRQKSKKSA